MNNDKSSSNNNFNLLESTGGLLWYTWSFFTLALLVFLPATINDDNIPFFKVCERPTAVLVSPQPPPREPSSSLKRKKKFFSGKYYICDTN